MWKRLVYFGHSCFLIEAENGWSAVLDPYENGSVPGLVMPHLTADAVFCSHEHADHSGRQNVSVNSVHECPYQIEQIQTYHDAEKGRLRGLSQVLVLENGAERIVHLGDLGCMPSGELLDRLADAEILMIPCGGYYTIDAETAGRIIAEIRPKLAVLMHYRTACSGYDVLASAEAIQNVLPDVRQLESSELIRGQAEGCVFLSIPEEVMTAS